MKKELKALHELKVQEEEKALVVRQKRFEAEQELLQAESRVQVLREQQNAAERAAQEVREEAERIEKEREERSAQVLELSRKLALVDRQAKGRQEEVGTLQMMIGKLEQRKSELEMRLEEEERRLLRLHEAIGASQAQLHARERSLSSQGQEGWERKAIEQLRRMAMEEEEELDVVVLKKSEFEEKEERLHSLQDELQYCKVSRDPPACPADSSQHLVDTLRRDLKAVDEIKDSSRASAGGRGGGELEVGDAS